MCGLIVRVRVVLRRTVVGENNGESNKTTILLSLMFSGGDTFRTSIIDTACIMKEISPIPQSRFLCLFYDKERVIFRVILDVSLPVKLTIDLKQKKTKQRGQNNEEKNNNSTLHRG